MMSENSCFWSAPSGRLALAADVSMEARDVLEIDENSREEDLAEVDKHPAYEYQPLPSNKHIRRLLLKPGIGRSPLVGTLQPTNLDSASSSTSFEAISYVWGSAIKNQFILVDGKPLPITTSLRESLLQVRLKNETRAIWADSVCIDQGNPEEKSDQVALMGRIYQVSSCTLICLGPAPERQLEAIKATNLIENVDRMIRRVYDDPGFSWGWNSFPWPDAEEPLLHDEAWTPWQTLVTHPWFRRGWVVQEAALGAMGLVFWAGVQIRWLSLQRVHYWLRWRARPRMPSFNILWGIVSLHQTAFKILCHREAKTFHADERRSRLEANTILETIDSARWMELSDPRDRIYAFMAMKTRRKMPNLRPDYTPETSYLYIYREFAVAYLGLTSDLDILGFVEYDDDSYLRDGRLASWIPQWDQGNLVYSERNWFRDWRKIEDIGIFPGSDQKPFSIIQGCSALQVRGIIIDSIKFVSDRLKDPNKDPSALDQMVSLWKDIAQRSTRIPRSQPTRLSLEFLSALARGEMEGERGKWNESMRTFAMALLSHLEQPKSSLGASTPRNAERIASTLMRWSRNRKFALLDRGHFGNTPDVTRKGDVCAIIYGTRTPFILRKVSVKGKVNCYRVVGAAYVVSKKLDLDGIPMRLGDDGCEDWREWLLPTKDIVLC